MGTHGVIYRHSVLTVPSETPVPTDAAQYMIRHGQKQFNLCGEFCVAYITQDTSHNGNIDEFLDYWQAKDLRWYQQVFHNGRGRTTGIYDLERMLAAYNYSTPCKHVSSHPVSIPYFTEMITYYQVIFGVHIDNTGYLVGRGIPHWIVIEDVLLTDMNHAVVAVYNPFTNNIEPYSWRELMTASGSYKQGIWIPRIIE